jgi:hypothetical protein
MRKFKSGGVRDDDNSKMDFEGFLSPIVLQAYGEYMHRHRHLVDGSLRDSDNWQKGFGDKHRDVCIKSLLRHVHDMWMEHRGYKSREDMDSALCGILFNAMAYYHDVLKQKTAHRRFSN